ncbi:MAG: carboxypeptidase regulatory-like domain-containing protein [Candidatus Dojkabacteria bacterium]
MKDEKHSSIFSIVRRPKSLFIFFLVLVVLVSIPILFIVLGFDQQILPTTLQGYVRDSMGNAVSKASVEVQGIEAETDDSGYFEVSELVYGVYEIKIVKNGYGTFSEEVKLQRLENNIDFVLVPLEFGEVRVQLAVAGSGTSSDDQPFYSSEFSATLNGTPLSYDRDFVIETDKLLIGTYALEVTSPYYKDIKSDLVVEPGLNELNLSLNPAADIVAEVKNWLTGDAVNPDKVEVKTGEVFVQLESKDLNGSQIELKDIDLVETIDVKVTKSGFNQLSKSLAVEQGRNSLGELKLVQEGNLLSVIDDGFNNQIFISNYDGSRSKNLLNTSLNCPEVYQTTSSGYVKCGAGLFYVIDLESGEIVDSLSGSGEIVAYGPASGDIVLVDNFSPSKVTRFVGETAQTVYSGEEGVTSLIFGRDGSVVFTTSNGVWRSTGDESETVKLSEGKFEVMDINSSGKTILLLNKAGGESNIWAIDTENLTKKKITLLPANHSDVRFINDNAFVFISDKTGTSGVYIQNINATLARFVHGNLSSLKVINGTRILHVYRGEGHFLLHVDASKLVRVRL